MAYYPYAPEIGARYELISPSGAVAVFNDDFDPNFVGMLTDVTGLDSPDVRESAEDLVEQDGGQHGSFWYGRRPITLSGRVFNFSTVAARNIRLDRLARASQALRSDATLKWRPATRRENSILSPRIVTTTNWTSAFTSGLTTTSFTANASGGRVQATQPADTTSRTATLTTATGTSGMAVEPNRSMYVTAQVVHTNAPALGSRVEVLWYKSDGTASSTASSAGTFVGVNTNGTFNPNLTVTVPSDAVYAAVRLTSSTATASDVIDVTWNNVLFTDTSMGTTYFDGTTTGFYWYGDADASPSGDHIEMLTWVRRQQPLREAGNWIKEFQCALVSEYAPVFSSYVKTLTSTAGGSVSPENRGSWPTYPIVRITGTASVGNPTVTWTEPNPDLVFRTTGLTLASGETLEVDMLNHTAKFIAGARNGQNGNSFIDWTNTNWLYLPTGTSTYQAATNTTVSVVWRDAWA